MLWFLVLGSWFMATNSNLKIRYAIRCLSAQSAVYHQNKWMIKAIDCVCLVWYFRVFLQIIIREVSKRGVSFLFAFFCFSDFCFSNLFY